MSTIAPAATTSSARLSESDRRTQLLQFGRDHFAAHGFDALPMQEMARRAGVSKGLLYHYFGGRRGFYLATVTDVIDGLLQALAPAMEETDSFDAVRRLCAGFVAYVERNAGIYQALVRGGLGADPDVGAQLDRVRSFAITALVPAGIEPTPCQRIQLVGWVAWVEASASAWLDTPDVDAPTFRDMMLQTLGMALQRVFREENA